MVVSVVPTRDSELTLKCAGNDGKSLQLKIPSYASLDQLYHRIRKGLQLPNQQYLYFSERSNLYKPILSVNHYDGWLLEVYPGTFLEHQHPHDPNLELSMSFVQLRNTYFWNVMEAINIESKLYLQTESELIAITVERCSLFSEGSKEVERYRNFEISSEKSFEREHLQPISENQLNALTMELSQVILEERNNFIEDIKLGFDDCMWVETTGEPCCYCTEDFL